MKLVDITRNYTVFAAGLALFLIVGCATTTNQGEIGVNRKQFLLVGAEELNQGAAQAYVEVLNKAKASGALNPDPNVTKRVRAITNRIRSQVSVFRADAPNWNWEVNVIKSEEINAWCMPGGKMAVYTGIIEKLKLTDDELAAIIGHEIAHALREHSRERASRTAAAQLGLSIGGQLAGIGQSGMDMAGMAAQVTFLLPNSRAQETEADLIGVELAARAGYDPRAAITLWQKMLRLNDARPPQILSTHPDPANRIEELEEASSRVMPLYQ